MPKVVDHEVYRIYILTRCLSLFAKKGYALVTMREISRELRVSTGSLYHYFSTKEVLFEEMARWVVREDAKRLVEIRDRNLNQNAAERLELLFDFVKEREGHFQNLILLACDLYRREDSEPAKTILKECSLVFRDAIESHLSLKNPEIETLFFSVLIGTIFQRMMNEGTIDFEKTFEVLRVFAPFLTNQVFIEPKKIGNDSG
ncbi:TetR/AcrR family transcriptional regulator [Leptospira sp. 201903070]|uniref:TetR/AcrR family transcriptional regulator n=1 Tax=Leptospira ainlahdjerensis TaxID=2810033 RepID=A0ABS2UDI3_9LEPT|nr:TetR/AcrR family transcriptional regulator [Leptospira ainlahdjerensis]MBM9576980.1 TetR/AcrR family transcriptional regulator [Leptospira ainlahdjerensis]